VGTNPEYFNLNYRFFLLSNPGRRPVGEDLEDELGGEEVGSGVSGLRAELHHIRPHQASPLTNEADQIDDLIPVEAAWFRGAHCRHLRGIEDIEVNGEVHLGAEVSENLLLPVGSPPDIFGVEHRKIALLEPAMLFQA
jgi:hypothetical protein